MTISELFQNIASVFRWWIVIAPWEQAIRVRHGSKVNLLGPGIHLRIPGLDRFFVQSVRLRYMSTPTQAVMTLDGEAITVSGGTSYSIGDIGVLYNTMQSAEDVIPTETMALVAEYITTHNLKDCKLASIQEFVTGKLSLEKYGLKDISFFVTDLVAVKTFRIINTGPKDWLHAGGLDTNAEKS